MNKRILVTGSAGFMGSHLVEELIEQGHDVIGIDDFSGGYKENIIKESKSYQMSINNVSAINSLFQHNDFDMVFHLAAYAAEGLSHFMKRFIWQNNMLGSINLINAAINNNVNKFIFTSSIAVYGTNQLPMSENIEPHPEDSYGISKLAVEQELKSVHDLFGMKYVILRPFNVYGEKQNIWDKYRNVMGIFMNQIMMKERPTIFGDGKQTRAFTYIKDVIPFIAKSAFISEANNEIINIGSENIYSINEIFKEICRAMNMNLRPRYLPARHEVKHAFCDTKKSKKILGFEEKYTLKEGIKNMAKWAKSIGPKKPMKWDNYEITKNLPEIWK